MEKSFIVYGLLDPRPNRLGELRYIGKSESGLHRPREHTLPSGRAKRTHCGSWLRACFSLGLYPEIIVLSECSDSENLSEQECYWISLMRFVGADLTNISIGGRGGSCGPRSDKTRSAVSESRKNSPIVKAQYSNPNYVHPLLGYKHTDTALKKIAESNRKRIVSDETRAKMSATKKRMSTTPEAKAAHSVRMQEWWAQRKENKHKGECHADQASR